MRPIRPARRPGAATGHPPRIGMCPGHSCGPHSGSGRTYGRQAGPAGASPCGHALDMALRRRGIPACAMADAALLRRSLGGSKAPNARSAAGRRGLMPGAKSPLHQKRAQQSGDVGDGPFLLGDALAGRGVLGIVGYVFLHTRLKRGYVLVLVEYAYGDLVTPVQ